MDYEFRRNPYGRYQADFSMGYEALGLWFSEELGGDHAMIACLLDELEQLINKQRWEYRHAGREFVLSMNQEGVEVHAALLGGTDDEVPDELSHYDQESKASCGLNDFRLVLLAWKEFVTEPVSG